jgi:dTMP kinase
VAIEGIDGSGKSTLTAELGKALGAAVCWVTSEPFRREKVNAAIAAGEDALKVFDADRMDHFREIINRALIGGKIVICDRYYWSTLVYQHPGKRGSHEAPLRDHMRRHHTPDLWVYLDVSAKVALERVEARGEADDFNRLATLRNRYLMGLRPPGAIISLHGECPVQHNVARLVLELRRRGAL